LAVTDCTLFANFARIFLAEIRNRRLQAEALQHLIQLLPPANRDTLEALVTFLGEVARHANDRRLPATGEWLPGNRMDSSNLATLFAPNILHQHSAGGANRDELSAERVEERADSINVVRAIIDNSHHLFEVRIRSAPITGTTVYSVFSFR